MSHYLPLSYEPRPRDFVMRLPRRGVRTLGLRARRRHSGRRALILLAAIAVPAVAAPDSWSNFHIGDAGSSMLALEPMPFEKAGDSFPGSAFYYLAQDDEAYRRPLGGALENEAGFPISGPYSGSDLAGPAARALQSGGTMLDRTRALQCLTAAIYYEAASEPDAGQRAVAQVVLNRVAHPSYPNTVCGVVYQGSERRTGCQFSFTCDGALARVPNRFFWARAEQVARAALSGFVYSPVGLATHYHTIQIHPYWADSLHRIGTIGAHHFYKFRGPAGMPATFRFAYSGGEPIAAPNPRSAAAVVGEDQALDPLALQRAYQEGLKAAQAGELPGSVSPTTSGLAPTRGAPAPTYAQDLQARGGEALYRGEKLPDATGIKPEYQESGRWIAQPGA